MKLFLIALLTTSFVIFLDTSAIGQSSEPSADPAIEKRISELETQLKAIGEELARIKQLNAYAKPSPTARTSPEPSKGELPAVKKKDLSIDVGNLTLTPYGTIYFNTVGNSGGTNNAEVPIFATPTGSGNVGASVRQTRLGLKLEGAKVGTARLAAVVEGDFFGGFLSIAIDENFGVFRIRLAYLKLEWERTTLTVGQDWMVFAPVNPVSIPAAGNPQMGAAGNLWARLPQVRFERKFGSHFALQAAMLDSQTGDFATNAPFVVQPTSGNASRVPFIQNRISFSDNNWFGTKKAGSIGISGHFGRSRVFTGTTNIRNDIASIAVALNWNFPLTGLVSFSGEAFLGRNLGGFQGGIFQSYNTDSAYKVGSAMVAGGVRSIGTRGGWAQIGFTPPNLKNKLGIYGSAGIDDPINRDLFSISHRDWRTRNLAISANVIYKFTPQFSIGAEFRRFVTNYLYSNRQSANHVNLGASYSF